MKIVDKLKNGFTLPELMSTILVFALVVAIALPTYREYIIRAKMVEVLTVLDNLLDSAKKQYVSSGTIPSTVGGFSSGTPASYTGSDCIAFINYDDGASWPNAGHAALVQAIISSECGQGMQGFEPGIAGAKNKVSMAFVASGESLKQYCGSWENDGSDVSLQYLPSGCQNSAFAATVTG